MKFLGERGARIYICKIFTDFLLRLKNLCEKYGGHIHICPRLSLLLYNYCELCVKFKKVRLSKAYDSLLEAILFESVDLVTACKCIHFAGKVDHSAWMGAV